MQSSLHSYEKNRDVFPWSHEDMLGIDPRVMSNRLNVDPTTRPVKQNKRIFPPERNKARAEEVDMLIKAKSIIEVHYPN